MRQRHTVTSNGDVASGNGNSNKKEDTDDRIAPNLVFDIQTLISVQTDFRQEN